MIRKIVLSLSVLATSVSASIQAPVAIDLSNQTAALPWVRFTETETAALPWVRFTETETAALPWVRFNDSTDIA